MSTTQKLVVSTELVNSPHVDFPTPTWVTTPEGYTFDWSMEDGIGYFINRGLEEVYFYTEDEIITPDSEYRLHFN